MAVVRIAGFRMRAIAMLFLLLSLFGTSLGAPRVETDPARIKSFVDELRKSRKPPADYHFARRADGTDHGKAAWRAEEFAAGGAYRYWKLQHQLDPAHEPVRREVLVGPDASGRPTVWESGRPAEPVQPGRAYTGDPLGFLSYVPDPAAPQKLELDGDRATLEFTATNGQQARLVFDLADGMIVEESRRKPAEGSDLRMRVTRRDVPGGHDAAFFEEIRARLASDSREKQQAAVRGGIAMLVALGAGALLPVVVALIAYRRRLLPPVAAKMAIGVSAFAVGLPAITYGLLVASKGYLLMFVTALTWPLVVGWLPLETARALSQFLNALLLSALMCAVIYRLLRWFVLARQG